MTNRVVIGQRGSELGIWVSKPGVDVLTASADNLMLDVTYHSEQIIQLGVASNGAVVALGLSVAPVVILYATANGFGAGGGSGLTRPNMGSFAGYLRAVISAASFSLGIVGSATGIQPSRYFVLRRAL